MTIFVMPDKYTKPRTRKQWIFSKECFMLDDIRGICRLENFRFEL